MAWKIFSVVESSVLCFVFFLPLGLQDLNSLTLKLCPLQWKHRGLTTGLPGNSRTLDSDECRNQKIRMLKDRCILICPNKFTHIKISSLAEAEGQGAPRSKDSFKEGKGVKQALRTEDAAGTVCKVEIKWSHRKSWMGLHGQTLLQEHWEVSERFESERNTITFIPLKYNPEGPFYHHFPTPTSMNDFFAASTRGIVPENFNCLLSYLEQLKHLSIFSAQQKENRELHTVLTFKRLH